MGTRTGSHGGFHSAEPDPEAGKNLKKNLWSSLWCPNPRKSIKTSIATVLGKDQNVSKILIKF
jgi:hypothetical protein